MTSDEIKDLVENVLLDYFHECELNGDPPSWSLTAELVTALLVQKGLVAA